MRVILIYAFKTAIYSTFVIFKTQRKANIDQRRYVPVMPWAFKPDQLLQAIGYHIELSLV